MRQEECYQRRNEAVRLIRGLGGDQLAKMIWGKLVGYNRRVEIESLIARWKKLYGGSLRGKSKERVAKEVTIKALMMNEMVDKQRLV